MSKQPKQATKKRRGLLALVAVIVVALVVAGGFALARSAPDHKQAIKIGVVGANKPYWATYKKAAAKQGIDVQIVNFANYRQINPALKAGKIDLNQFQYLGYLAYYNLATKSDLTPIGSTAIFPLGLYSKKDSSVKDLKYGDTVAVPRDASGQARGLLILQSAGLIKLKSGGSIYSKLSDVDTAGSKVRVRPLTETSLHDFSAAVINNNYVAKVGLKYSDAIAQDDPKDPHALPYVNVFAARAADKDNKTYKKLVEIYQNTRAVTDGADKVAGNNAVFVKTPAAELRSALATVEKQTAARR